MYGVQLHRRGVVLIVVLVLVVMIALAGFSFANSMGTEYEAAKIAGDELQADQTLLSAETFVAQYLRLPAEQRLALGGEFDNETLFRARPVIANPELAGFTGDRENVRPSDSTWQFSILSGPPASNASSQLSESRGVRFGLVNESNKLHLGAILAWDRVRPGAGRAVLMKLPRMTPELADAVLDWIDPDNEPREFGAEADYYGSLPQPYRVANRLPGSLDDLRLVRGVTSQVLYGPDLNRNFRVDRAEGRLATLGDATGASEANDEELSGAGWSDLLTLHSATKNVNRFGGLKIDLNQLDLPTLLLQLQTLVPEDVAKFIVLYRQYGPSQSAGAGSVSQVTLDMATPWKFKMNSVADLVDARVTVPGEPAVTVRSPLSMNSGELRELLPMLLSETTTLAAPVLAGGLNINTADEAILRAVPFFSDDTVTQILSQRESISEGPIGSIAWLLTENVLSRETFIQVQPWLTAGGDVFSCQLFVFRGSRGPIRRVHAVFDAASAEPRRLEWVDLRPTGRGFAWSEVSVREEIDVVE